MQAVADCEIEKLKKSLQDMEISLQRMLRALSRMHGE